LGGALRAPPKKPSLNNKIMIKKLLDNYNPLIWLSALGAGGISIGAFVILQYTLWGKKGLAVMSQMEQTPIVLLLEAIMLIFGSISLALTIYYGIVAWKWRKTEKYHSYSENPLVNAGLMAMYVSLAMSLNVFIGVVRYFSDYLSSNFQSLMLPGFIAFAILWFTIMNKEIQLLAKTFTKGFDMDKIHFGWLLHPFALGMITVTGTGLAAMSHTSWIAEVSAFMTLISGTMGMFLMSVKLFSIFKKHFHQEGALDNQFMPTYIIVIPIITVFAISYFRLGHFAENNLGVTKENIHFLLEFGMATAFAFQVWYFWFGLVMLKDYWKNYFKTHFHVSQWGVICPFVGFSVLGGFIFKLLASYSAFFYFLIGVLLIAVVLYLYLLKRQFKCIKAKKTKNFICD